jgi:hypothetical protein
MLEEALPNVSMPSLLVLGYIASRFAHEGHLSLLDIIRLCKTWLFVPRGCIRFVLLLAKPIT